MRSSFSRARRRLSASSSKTNLDEVYDFKGLNLITPDQVMPLGETPFTINSRRYAKNETDTRVAIHTRQGSTIFSTPVGETADTENVATSEGDLVVAPGTTLALPFINTVGGALTKLELELKKITSGTGPLLIDIYTDSSSAPGALLGSSSISPVNVTTAFQYLAAYFMDAPSEITSGTYWIVLSVQEGGTASYVLNQTAGSLLSKTLTSTGWTPASYAFRYKTYISTAGLIKGFTRRNPQDIAYTTVFALGTNIYKVPDTTKTPASIYSGVSINSQAVRFAQVDDKTFWVDGEGVAKWWDGTTVSTIANVAGTPTNVIIYENRALFIPKDDPNRVNFSELYDFETYPSVNFFYVPNPKSPDHIMAWHGFQSGLTVLTRDSKYIVTGSSISTFTMDPVIGTKGCVSQEASAVDRNYIYFMSPDKHIYRFNGVSDELISGKMEPEFQSILDPKKVHIHLYRNQLRVYYNTKADSTFNRMALYDIESQQWFRDTGRSVLGSLEDVNGNLLEFSSRVGWMFNGESGASDLGKAIDFKYWTNYKMYGSGIAKDRIRKFRPIMRPSDISYTLKVGKDVDFENSPDMRDYLVDSGGAKWGNFTWGDGTKWGGGKKLIDNASAMSGRGKHTQFRFECNLVDVAVQLLGYAAIVKSGRPQ